ncbi:putative ribonuclease H-like domain-containing protein [Tanacetum coccineum]
MSNVNLGMVLNAHIIEEYESDSEDEYVSIPTKQQETPSFANQQVKTPRETVKNQFTHSQKPKVDKKELGYGFTVRACFVCGSLNHLIRDCDFHEKRMARKAELNNELNRNSGQREKRPIWNNVQRVNKQNQFVPSAVLTRTGKIPVNTARASGTKNVSTARQSFNRQAVLTSTAMKVNTVKPIVNRVRPANVFHKTHSPSSRPFKKTTVLSTNFSKQKVNTAKVNAVSAVGGKRETAVKPSAGCNWRPQRYNWHNISKYNGGSSLRNFKNRDFIEFCGSKGIKREYSNARTPQQNGVAERKNRTLIEAARTMLADSFLPNTFWAEAVSTACYVLNRVLVTKPHNKTPYELVTGKGPTWLFDLDYLTDSMNYQPVRSENQANKHAGPQEANHNAGTKDNYSSTVKRSTKKDAGEAPTKHPDLKRDANPANKEDQVFLDELERLKRQEKDANDAAEA